MYRLGISPEINLEEKTSEKFYSLTKNTKINENSKVLNKKEIQKNIW